MEEQGKKRESVVPGIDTETVRKVMDWIQGQKQQQDSEGANKDRICQLQHQVELMTKPANRQQCQMTGVNFFTSLDAIQGEGGGVDLAAKARAAMTAATDRKRCREDEEESDGESSKSNYSLSKVKNYKSGLGVKTGQKVRYEVEWAHHLLWKEYDANPLAFNQMKIGQYLMGEADIILNCSKPEEIRSRLRLMRRIGYWYTKFDWVSCRNVYAAIMRGMETGREDWSFDIKEYEDMLNVGTGKGYAGREEKVVKKGRDTFFCGPFQKGECDLDSPHLGTIGQDNVQRMVYHICSGCLLKDRRKLHHPNGGPGCLHLKL